MVGVLVLVDQDVPEPPAVVLGHVGEPDHQRHRVPDQVVEVDGLGPGQARLIGGVDVGQRRLGVVGALGSEGVGVDQLVLQPRDLVEQPAGGHPLGVEVQVAGHERDQAKAVGLVVDREGRLHAQALSLPAQDAHAGRVERRDPHRASPRPHSDLNTLAHLGGGLVREGDGQDLAWSRIPGGKQVGDPTGEHTGLARACPGDDQQGAAAVLDSLALRRVEVADQVHHLRGPLGLTLRTPIGRLGIGTPLGRGHRGTHHVGGPSGLRGTRSMGVAARAGTGDPNKVPSSASRSASRSMDSAGMVVRGRRGSRSSASTCGFWVPGPTPQGQVPGRLSGPGPSCAPPRWHHRSWPPTPTSSTCGPSSGP